MYVCVSSKCRTYFVMLYRFKCNFIFRQEVKPEKIQERQKRRLFHGLPVPDFRLVKKKLRKLVTIFFGALSTLRVCARRLTKFVLTFMLLFLFAVPRRQNTQASEKPHHQPWTCRCDGGRLFRGYSRIFNR